jgi:hypothetical protein
MGYVLDQSSQSVRPVNGIPGSSSLGLPLELPFHVAAAAFSPNSNFALVVSASDDRNAYVLRNLSGTVNIDPVEGGILGVDRVFLNSDGPAAALIATDSVGLAHSGAGVGSFIDSRNDHSSGHRPNRN